MTRADTDKNAGIYIHIPFCRSKCPYCDFYSLPSLALEEAYTDALCRELKTKESLQGQVVLPADKITADSIYLGGGTPSQLKPVSAVKILTAAQEGFKVTPEAEITAECNPSSEGLSEFLSAAHSVGLGRLSIGLQSADSAERRALGRLGGAEEAAKAVKTAQSLGIHNISVDIMLGIPFQTGASLKKSLDFALSLNVSHISAYMLKIEPGTLFYRRRESLSLPDEDSTADMYLFMCRYLQDKGMRQYEISNFCFDGLYSRHNMKYWTLDDYLGFGASAHSFYNGRRFYFSRDINAFIAGAPAVFEDTGGGAGEYIMLGLRLDTGIEFSVLYERFGVRADEKFYSWAKKLVTAGFIRLSQSSFSLTHSGFLVSNSIIGKAIDLLIN